MSALVLALVLPAAAGDLEARPAVDLPLTLASGSIWAGLYLGVDRQEVEGVTGEAPGGLDALAPTELREGPALASDVLMYGSIGTGLVVAVADGLDKDVGGRVLLYAEAFALNGAATELTKHAVRRPRPYTFGDQAVSEPDDHLSFFSGHSSMVAATTFTTARSLDLSRDLGPWGRLAVYGAATALSGATAALRVAAGKHFPSDVIAGVLVGGGIGWLVPELHRSDARVGTWADPGGARGVRVSWRW